MKNDGFIKTFSLQNVKFCEKPELDVVLFIHDETSIYTDVHTHDFFELTFVESGELVHVINKKEFVLNSGDACLLHPRVAHKLSPVKNGLSIFSFGINSKFLKQLATCYNLDFSETFLKEPIINFRLSQREITNLLQTISLIGKKDIIFNTNLLGKDAYNSIIKIIITEFIFKIFKLETSSITPKHHPFVTKFLNEINTPSNFQYDLTEICSKLKYSHGHINHLFRKENLDSPSKIFLRNKLAHAAMLLQNSDMKITSIMEICGFFSSGYFNTSFKKEFGFSPRNYRNSSRKNMLNIYDNEN